MCIYYYLKYNKSKTDYFMELASWGDSLVYSLRHSLDGWKNMAASLGLTTLDDI